MKTFYHLIENKQPPICGIKHTKFAVWSLTIMPLYCCTGWLNTSYDHHSIDCIDMHDCTLKAVDKVERGRSACRTWVVVVGACPQYMHECSLHAHIYIIAIYNYENAKHKIDHLKCSTLCAVLNTQVAFLLPILTNHELQLCLYKTKQQNWYIE